MRPSISPRFALLLVACATASLASSCSDSPSASTASSSSSGEGPDASACTYAGGPEPVIPAPPRHTPRWAFEPWISKDISSGPDTYDFVQGFFDRDIPVGAVVLDSPWETHYNTFPPNPARYPDFADMVSDLHAKDVRVVLWITQFVNSTAFD